MYNYLIKMKENIFKENKKYVIILYSNYYLLFGGAFMYCDECGFKNKETAKFCKKCGASLVEEDNQEANKIIKNKDVEKVLEEDFDSSQDEMKLNKKQLLEYLNMGKDLEINKLGLENGIKDLENLDKKKYNEIVKPLKKNEKPIFSAFPSISIGLVIGIIVVLAIPTFIIVIMNYRKYYDSLFSKWFAWDFPELFAAVPITIVVLLILAVVLVIAFAIIEFILHNTIGRKKYSIKMKEYKKENEQIDKTNANQLKLYNENKTIIDDRISNVKQDLKDVEKTMSKYYDLDVIYPKYRNLVAITTFIEYLESGRCKSLYGYTGCYNVYEQELRQNTIIGKLDQVLIQLDQIKKVQFATYIAIQQSNAIQSAMLNTCNEMLDETRRENATLEAKEQDTKIIKRNSEIMTTISTLNYIKHN